MDEARRLRAKGWNVTRLALYFSVQKTTIRRWLDPKYDEEQRRKNKKRKEQYRGRCVICGSYTTGSNGPNKAPKYCLEHAFKNPDRYTPEKIWPKERIIRAIQEWAAIHGKPPSMADWNPYQARSLGDEKRARYFEQNKDIWPWFTHVVKKFGSWNAAIKAAGFTPRLPHGTVESAATMRPKAPPKPDTRKYWTRELILQKMKEWNELYGEPPKSTTWLQPVEIVDNHRIWPGTGQVQKEFGSWSRGMRAAGFEPWKKSRTAKKVKKRQEPKHPPRPWTKEEVLELIRKWVEEHRLPPTKNDWKKLSGYPAHSTVFDLFGSWNDAIREAGFHALPQGTTATAVKALLPLPRGR